MYRVEKVLVEKNEEKNEEKNVEGIKPWKNKPDVGVEPTTLRWALRLLKSLERINDWKIVDEIEVVPHALPIELAGQIAKNE